MTTGGGSKRGNTHKGVQREEVFDTLVQSATVALFHAYGVAAAPLTPTTEPVSAFQPEFPVGAICFRGKGIDCALIVSTPQAVRSQMRLDEHRRWDERDLAKELVNQAMGRLKNRLSQYQVELTCGLPICADRPNQLDRAMRTPGPLTVYRFRTIHGHILVSLKGTIDPGALAYSGTIKLYGEGEVIILDDPKSTRNAP